MPELKDLTHQEFMAIQKRLRKALRGFDPRTCMQLLAICAAMIIESTEVDGKPVIDPETQDRLRAEMLNEVRAYLSPPP